MSAASGGNSEPKQGQRSQSARGFCPRSTMRGPQPDIIEHFGNADAVPQLPERCLSRKAGIVRCCLSSTTPIENVRKTKMLRKGEQRSPTEVCHVYDINVRCYVKAAGAQCAPLCVSTEFLIHEKFRERFRAAAILPMLGTAVLRGKPAKSGRLFLCCLQIDKCTTNTYAVIGAQRMRNMGKGGC